MTTALTEPKVIIIESVDQQIQAWKGEYMALSVEKDGIDAVHEARMTLVKTRTSIDAKRKSLNEDALRHQRAVNAEAKRLVELIEPIEAHLTQQETAYKTEQERIKAEKKAAEDKRIADRVNRLAKIDFSWSPLNEAYAQSCSELQLTATQVRDLDDESFDQFIVNATPYWEREQFRIAEAERLRIEKEAREAEAARMEQERLAEIARKEAAERARIEAELAETRRKHEELLAQVQADKEAREAEARRIEQERQAEERRRKQEAENEQIRVEAAEKARADERARAEAERLAAEEKARMDAERAARKARLAPDREKLVKLKDALAGFELPEMKHQEGRDVIAHVSAELHIIVEYIESKIDTL